MYFMRVFSPSPVLGRGGRGVRALPLLGAVMALLIAGCGGGGGGGGSSFTNRTFQFAATGAKLDMTVDPGGRFTIFESDPTHAAGVSAQGVVGSNGQFSAQSSNGAVQFTGTVSGDGSAATGNATTVATGQGLFAFNAALVQPAPDTSAYAGTFTGTASGSSAALSVDTTGHGALFATVNGVSGGGLISVSSTGAVTSSDGTAGQLTAANGSLTLQLTSLNGQAASATIPLTRVTRAKWTFLVYMNAANDLQPFAPTNVKDMEQVGSTSDVNMVLEWQQAQCGNCGSPDWVGTRRYFITKSPANAPVSSQLVQDLGQTVDTGNWQELLSFINWGQSHYPADHYALVLWDHGSGWLDIPNARARPRSVSFNFATGTQIFTWQLPQALTTNPHMDLVVFDASLLQQMEVDYQIRNSTPIIVGSEESPPGRGYIYNTFLSDLVGNPNMTPAQFGADIVNRTISQYAQFDNNAGDLSILTQSEIDTTRLQNLATAIDAFGASLINHRTDSATVLANARNNAKNYAATEGYADYKDLYDYADKVRTGGVPADLALAASNVQSALTAAVMAEGHASNEAGSHGLTIDVAGPGQLQSTYSNLDLARNTSWMRWLQSQTQ